MGLFAGITTVKAAINNELNRNNDWVMCSEQNLVHINFNLNLKREKKGVNWRSGGSKGSRFTTDWIYIRREFYAMIINYDNASLSTSTS